MFSDYISMRPERVSAGEEGEGHFTDVDGVTNNNNNNACLKCPIRTGPTLYYVHVHVLLASLHVACRVFSCVAAVIRLMVTTRWTAVFIEPGDAGRRANAELNDRI